MEPIKHLATRKLTPDEQRTSEYLYGFFLGLMSGFDADMFKQMAELDMSPFDLGIEVDEQSINYISNLIKKYSNRIDEYLNYDWIMSRMQKRRPDLYDFFITPLGKQALSKWIVDIKNMIMKVIR